MGWITDGFYPAKENIAQRGIGDDVYSFGVDGDRVKSWYDATRIKFG